MNFIPALAQNGLKKKKAKKAKHASHAKCRCLEDLFLKVSVVCSFLKTIHKFIPFSFSRPVKSISVNLIFIILKGQKQFKIWNWIWIEINLNPD